MKNKYNIYFVMGLLVFSIITGSALAKGNKYAPFPKPDRGYVTDIADLLSSEEEERIESWLYTLEKENNVEVIVVTVNSIKDYKHTPNKSIEDFATALFNKYGIGNMPKNDGVLLLIAKKDRKARIELGKYYGHRRDADANKIMQRKIIPHFKKYRYSDGIKSGVKGIMLEFGSMRIIPGWVKPAIIITIIIMIPISISLFIKGKRGWGWICIALLGILLFFLFKLSYKTVKALPHDAGAGGLGGFGGGSSGGGGASGSW